MAVRKDEVQISIAFLTDESKQYAKLVTENKAFLKDLRKAKKEGKDLTGVVNQIVSAGKKVEGIDLKKLAPAQLVSRARQLKQVLSLIPQSAPQYKQLEKEMSDINNELAEMRTRTRGVSSAQTRMASTGSKAFQLLGRAVAFIGIAQLGRSLVDTTAKFQKFQAVLEVVEALLDAQVGEFERLKELGIRGKKNGDQVVLSFRDQTVEVKNTEGAIRDAILAFGDLEGVQGSTAAISATLGGQLSNLQDKITNLLNTIGQSLSGSGSGNVFSFIGDVLDELNFTFSEASEKAKILTDDFLSQKKEVDDLGNKLNPLLSRYDELTSKSELSHTEQRELEKVIREIGKITPKSIEEIDKYGNALKINAGASREFLEAEQARLKFINKDQIKELQRLRENTEALIDVEKRIIDRKDEEFLGFELFNSERVGEAARNIGQYQEDIKGIEAQLKQLSGAFDEVENKPTFDFLGNVEPDNATPTGAGTSTQADNAAAEKRKAQRAKELEELRLLTITAREKEIEDMTAHYDRLMALAAKYNQDSTDLERQKNEALSLIREQNQVDEIESGFSSNGQMILKRRKMSKPLSHRERPTSSVRWSNKLFNLHRHLFKLGLTYWEEMKPLESVMQTKSRTLIQTAKVNQQKFGLGGLLKFGLGGLKKMGIFGGRPHSSGGTKGYFEDGTQIEVEKDELFAVVNKRDTRLLNALSTANSRNGNAFFQDGGLLGLNTTPSNSFSTNNIGGSDFDFSELIMEFRMMRRENAQRNNTLQAFVSLDDLNAAQSQLSSIENEAAL